MLQKLLCLFLLGITTHSFASSSDVAKVSIPGLHGVDVGLSMVSNSDDTSYFYGRLGINQDLGPIHFKDVGVVISVFEFKIGLRFQIGLLGQDFAVETFRKKETLEFAESEQEKKARKQKEKEEKEKKDQEKEKKTTPLALCPSSDPLCSQMTSKKELAKLVDLDKDEATQVTSTGTDKKKPDKKTLDIKKLELKTFFVDRSGTSKGIKLWKAVSIDNIIFTLNRNEDAAQKLQGLKVGMSFFGAADTGAAADAVSAYEDAQSNYDQADVMYNDYCQEYDDDPTDDAKKNKDDAEKEKNDAFVALNKATNDVETAKKQKMVMRVSASVEKRVSDTDCVLDLVSLVDDTLKKKKLEKKGSFFIARAKLDDDVPLKFFASGLPQEVADIPLSDFELQYVVDDTNPDNKGVYGGGAIDLSGFDVFQSGKFECKAFYSPVHDFALSVGMSDIKITGVPLPETLTFKVRRQQDLDSTELDKEGELVKPKRDASGKLPYVYTLEGEINLHDICAQIPTSKTVTLIAQFSEKKLLKFKAKGPSKLDFGNGFGLYNILLEIQRKGSVWVTEFSGKLLIDIPGLKKFEGKVTFGVDKDKNIIFTSDIKLGSATIAAGGLSILELQDMIVAIKKNKDGASLGIKSKVSLFGAHLPATVEFVAGGGKSSAFLIISDHIKGSDLPEGLKWIKDLEFVIADSDFPAKKITKGTSLKGTISFDETPMKEIGMPFGLKGDMDFTGEFHGIDNFSIYVSLINANIDPDKVKGLEVGKLELHVDIGAQKTGAGGALDIYIKVPGDKSVLLFKTKLDIGVLPPPPAIQIEGSLQQVGTQKVGTVVGTWKEPFGLKGLEIGPLGLYASITPGVVPMIPKSFGLLGHVAFGRNEGDIQLMADESFTNSGFKIYMYASLGGLVQATFNMFGVDIGTMPDIATGLFYMSFAPQELRFPGLVGYGNTPEPAPKTDVSQSVDDAKAAQEQKEHLLEVAKQTAEIREVTQQGSNTTITVKKTPDQQIQEGLASVAPVSTVQQTKNVPAQSAVLPGRSKLAAAFPGVDTGAGIIPGGFYFYSSLDFLNIFSIDVCMAAPADLTKPQNLGVYGGAKVALSDAVQNIKIDGKPILTLKRGHNDPKYDAAHPNLSNCTQELVNKYGDLPCLKSILGGKEGAALFFAFSPKLRMFLMSAEMQLNIGNFNVMTGDVYVQLLQDNDKYKIPTFDFYVEGKILEVLEAHVSIHARGDTVSFEAMVKNKLIEKLLEWNKELFKMLQDGLKKAEKALDSAQKAIGAAEQDVKNAFKEAHQKLEVLNQAIAEIDKAQQTVGAVFTDAKRDVNKALDEINAIVNQLTNMINDLFQKMEHMNLLDMIELKPLLWSIEIVALQVGKDMVRIVQESARVAAQTVLNIGDLTTNISMEAAKGAVAAAKGVADGVLFIGEGVAIGGMEITRGVLKGTEGLLKYVASPILVAVEETINAALVIIGELFNIRLIKITCPDAKQLKADVLLEMKILGQSVTVDFSVDLKRPDKTALALVEGIMDAIKKAVVGAIESIAHI